MSIFEQLSGIEGMGSAPSETYTGITLAEITNISDPQAMGRVKCQPLSSSEDVKETDWCYVMTPFGGKDYGMFFHPNVGDMAVLAYQNGEIHRPIVIGSVWNEKSPAPLKIQDEKNEVYSLTTPKKNTICLTDTDGKEDIKISTPSGSRIELNDEKKTLEVSDSGSGNQLQINFEKGEITLKADKKLTLAVGGTSITLTSSGDITLKSGKNVTVKAVKLATDCSAETQIKSSGKLNLESTGITVVKGSLVKIN